MLLWKKTIYIRHLTFKFTHFWTVIFIFNSFVSFSLFVMYFCYLSCIFTVTLHQSILYFLRVSKLEKISTIFCPPTNFIHFHIICSIHTKNNYFSIIHIQGPPGPPGPPGPRGVQGIQVKRSHPCVGRPWSYFIAVIVLSKFFSAKQNIAENQSRTVNITRFFGWYLFLQSKIFLCLCLIALWNWPLRRLSFG